MIWVLKRTISQRWFFSVPKTCFNKETNKTKTKRKSNCHLESCIIQKRKMYILALITCLMFLLTLCMLGNFSYFLSPADFFKIFKKKIFSGVPSECQTDWIQIRTDILSVLIWVQTVCKGYQQRTLKKIKVGVVFRTVNYTAHVLVKAWLGLLWT